MVSHSVVVFLGLLHAIVFGGWTLGVAIAIDQPAWFMSGSLGFTFASATIVLVTIPLVRATSLSQLETFRTIVADEQRGRRSIPASRPRSLLQKVAERGTSRSSAPPPPSSTALDLLDRATPPEVSPGSAKALLVSALAGLVFIAWYMTQTLLTKYLPLLSTSTVSRQLAHELWITQPGATIAMLSLLGLTTAMHLVDVILAIVVLANCKDKADDEEELDFLRGNV